MILLDTCILIEHYRGANPSVSGFLASYTGEIYISAITDMEVAYGVRNKHELQQHQKLLEVLNITILDIDQTVSSVARQWVRDYGLSHTLHLADALIAATAHCHNLTLYTFNLSNYSAEKKCKKCLTRFLRIFCHFHRPWPGRLTNLVQRRQTICNALTVGCTYLIHCTFFHSRKPA